MGKFMTQVILFTDSTNIGFVRYLGAYHVASSLRDLGYTVQVIDHMLLCNKLILRKLIEKFTSTDTVMVGFSTTFMNLTNFHLNLSSISNDTFQYNVVSKLKSRGDFTGVATGVPISDDDMLFLTTEFRKINPNIKFVMGGEKANFKRQKYIDTFILGHAQFSLPKYIEFLLGNNQDSKYIKNLNGQIVISDDINANGFDFSNHVVKFHSSDKIDSTESLTLETARGCIFRCKFCSFRYKGKEKLENVKYEHTLYDQLMYNYENFGTTNYIFSDDTFNDSEDKLLRFKKVFDRLPFKIQFAAYIRLDLISKRPHTADMLFDIGLKSATFGIETLNNKSLKIIGKGVKSEELIQTLNNLRFNHGWKNNIIMSSGFIVGLPEDSKSDVTAWASEVMSPDFPLDSLSFSKLYIKKLSQSLHHSEFELNYGKYGYRYDTTISSGWINDYWTEEEASHTANLIDAYVEESGRSKMLGFSTFLAKSNGITFCDLKNKSNVELKREIEFKMVMQAKQYFYRLLNSD